jgi:hypothetical protein
MHLRSRLFYSYVVFLVVYSCFTLLPAPSPIILARYHLSALGLRIIDVTIVLIVAVIWYVGFYSYAKLRAYVEPIRKDGKHVARLTDGIFLLVMWLPVSSAISSVLKFVAMHHTGFIPAAAIINNYISLALPLAGVVLIGLGARGLSEIVKQRPTHIAISILAALLIYIGLVYYRLVATTDHRASVYHMSIWLILLTVVAPYIYMWFMGLLATYEIFNYRLKVAGVVYRSSWKLLALGIGWLILSSIAVQYLTTLTARLNSLSIYWILVIVYSLLLVYSIGFVLIALGARKLQKIEEV